MTANQNDIYALIEARRSELEEEIAGIKKELDRLEVEEKRLLAELADLPIRPAKKPAKKGARKAKRVKVVKAEEHAAKDAVEAMRDD